MYESEYRQGFMDKLAQEAVHVVKPGDVLSRIAAQNGVPVEQLAAYNQITDPNRIRPGQPICIPPRTPVQRQPVPVQRRRVQPVPRPVQRQPVPVRRQPVPVQRRAVQPAPRPASRPAPRPVQPAPRPAPRPATSTVTPDWLHGRQFRDYLVEAENAGRTGFNPETELWSTYPDKDKDGSTYPAVGPGIRVPNANTTYTQAQLDNLVREKLDSHWAVARRRYPDIGTLHQGAQQALMDMTWMGQPAPKMYGGIQRGDWDTVAREARVHHEKNGITVPNDRRNTLMRDRLLEPYRQTITGQRAAQQ